MGNLFFKQRDCSFSVLSSSPHKLGALCDSQTAFRSGLFYFLCVQKCEGAGKKRGCRDIILYVFDCLALNMFVCCCDLSSSAVIHGVRYALLLSVNDSLVAFL